MIVHLGRRQYLRGMEREVQVFSLSQLSAVVAGVLRMHFSRERYWVTAEIINLKISRGHCYLQLAEKDEMGINPRAEFRGIIWASTFDRLAPRFRRETGRDLGEQMQVLLEVEVHYHERYGLSLLVHNLDASFTLGQMELERRKTLERLHREGMLDLNRSLEMAPVLQRLAVLSAEDSKGYQDFMQRLEANGRGYMFHTELFTSLLQGDLAASDMVVQLGRIREKMMVQPFDAVVLVRGGGGASSLEAFNRYEPAAAIAKFPVPVITGIGHHANRSVCDEVAHTARMTPTDVALFIIEQNEAFEESVEDCWRGIAELAAGQIKEEQVFLQDSAKALMHLTRLRLSEAGRQLDQSAYALQHHTRRSLLAEAGWLNSLHPTLFRLCRQQLLEQERRLDDKKQNLQQNILNRLQKEEQLLHNSETRCRLLDPVSVLRRGYSYTVSSKGLVTDPAQVKSGDVLQTITAGGEIISTVNTTSDAR